MEIKTSHKPASIEFRLVILSHTQFHPTTSYFLARVQGSHNLLTSQTPKQVFLVKALLRYKYIKLVPGGIVEVMGASATYGKSVTLSTSNSQKSFRIDGLAISYCNSQHRYTISNG